MICRTADLVIQEALDGALSPAARARLDAHLFSCAACRQTWDSQRALARVVGRWARPRPSDDPGDAFNAAVLARISVRPAPVYRSLWVPLVATSLLIVLLACLPGLLSPGLDAVGGAARQTPDWLLANLRGVPSDASGAWSALTIAVPFRVWVWPAFLAAVIVNAMFCFRARQAQMRGSLS